MICLTLSLLLLAGGALYQSGVATTMAALCMASVQRSVTEECRAVVAAFNEKAGHETPLLLAALATLTGFGRLWWQASGTAVGSGRSDAPGDPPREGK